ncbi:glycosyltransferase [Actinomycetota bacterium]
MKEILDYPLITISIVNLNGQKYLKDCLESINNLNYPQEKIEIVVVDNGSSDNSVEFLKANYSVVKIIKNKKNIGFARANNQAAEIARGEYIAFLNNDTKVDKNWLIELLRPIYMNDEIVASGSKVLSMDGKSLDFVGGMINFEGKGFQIDYGVSIEDDEHHIYKYMPFVNGGAMMVQKAVFIGSGGFDEDFFAYYEDVDFGWRLWVLGYMVIFAPNSVVYHHHHGTSKIFSEDKLRFLKERNSLYSVFKNYDEKNLARALSGTLISIFNRTFTDLDFDYESYYDLTDIDPVKNDKGSTKTVRDEVRSGKIRPRVNADKIHVGKEPLSSLAAARSFYDNLPMLVEKRKWIQKNRKRDDRAVFSYFKGQFMPVSSDSQYQKNQLDILKQLGIYEIFKKDIERTLLIVSSEVVSREMAGPGIRIWNFAEVLSENMNVILAIPNETDFREMDFKVIQYKDNGHLAQIVRDADIVLCNGMTLSRFNSIKNSGKHLIIDVYDPYNLATLAEYEGESMEEKLKIYKIIQHSFNEQFYYGDFFICASDRQRDYWLGMLSALNRVNPFAYNIDSSLKRMIDIVPFGHPSYKPMHTKQVLKGEIEGIHQDDFVIIWGGGIYNWFDPLTLIRAMVEVKKVRDDVKLFFMGVEHPNPEVKALRMVNNTIKLSKKLGLYDKNVFFNFEWVDYENRQNYLLESDIGIITHPNHIETRFSFRTRILDYIWTGLPIITTEGDYLSDMIKFEEMGIITKDGDESDVARAILKMAQDKDFYNNCKKNIEKKRGDFTWEKVCQPIIDFCRDPVSNALKSNNSPQTEIIKDNLYTGNDRTTSGRKSLKKLVGRFFFHLFKSGPRSTIRYVLNYMSQK